MIIHKQGKQKVNRYAGFGRYEDIPAPLCVGAKSVYNGKSYYLHRNWKYVTCKHCLKKKPTSDNSIYETTQSEIAPSKSAKVDFS